MVCGSLTCLFRVTLLVTQSDSLSLHPRGLETADYTYSTVPRRCGGSHTLTYPYRRNRPQHLSPLEEIQIAMKVCWEEPWGGQPCHAPFGKPLGPLPSLLSWGLLDKPSSPASVHFLRHGLLTKSPRHRTVASHNRQALGQGSDLPPPCTQPSLHMGLLLFIVLAGLALALAPRLALRSMGSLLPQSLQSQHHRQVPQGSVPREGSAIACQQHLHSKPP